MGWLIGMCRANRGRLVLEALEASGFLAYYPQTYRDQRRKEVVPLFGRYFFIQHCERWASLFSLRGLDGLLTVGGKAVTIRDCEVDAIKSREKDGVVLLSEERQERFRKDQEVIIVSGAFEGKRGKYLSRGSGKDREAVLLSLLGRSAKVEVAANALEPA